MGPDETVEDIHVAEVHVEILPEPDDFEPGAIESGDDYKEGDA